MKITIDISETIRVAPYETIRPGISIEFEVPEGADVKEFYLKKYRDVKNLWNLHLYNLLYDTTQRTKVKDIFEHAQNLILGPEKFPMFKLKKKKKKKKEV